ILGGCQFYSFTENSSLFPCLCSPLSSNNITGLAIFHKVHWNHGKLCVCSALKEKYFIVIRNVHQCSQISLCFLNDRLKGFGAMTHFHNAHTCSFVIQHFICCLLQNFHRKHCRSCRKIPYSAHFSCLLF